LDINKVSISSIIVIHLTRFYLFNIIRLSNTVRSHIQIYLYTIFFLKPKDDNDTEPPYSISIL